MLLRVILIAAAVYIVIWLLRGGGRTASPPRQAGKPPAAPATEMVQCAHCGVHLPRDEALPGRGGVYCGEAHRVAGERGSRSG